MALAPVAKHLSYSLESGDNHDNPHGYVGIMNLYSAMFWNKWKLYPHSQVASMLSIMCYTFMINEYS